MNDQRILVIFGSESDARIYTPIIDEFDKNQIKYDFRVASAHKAPHYLGEILEGTDEKYRLVISGAGLAAHLPGVIASKTIRPVIGVPIDVNFGGIDSLLSIVQMPPGVPVLTVGIDCYREAARLAVLMTKKYDHANIISRDEPKKIMEMLGRFKAPFKVSTAFDADRININLLEAHKDSINVPLIEPTAENISGLSQMTKKGLWVGVGRMENAALAAVEVLNHDGRYSEALLRYRKETEDKFRSRT